MGTLSTAHSTSLPGGQDSASDHLSVSSVQPQAWMLGVCLLNDLTNGNEKDSTRDREKPQIRWTAAVGGKQSNRPGPHPRKGTASVFPNTRTDLQRPPEGRTGQLRPTRAVREPERHTPSSFCGPNLLDPPGGTGGHPNHSDPRSWGK